MQRNDGLIDKARVSLDLNEFLFFISVGWELSLWVGTFDQRVEKH